MRIKIYRVPKVFGTSKLKVKSSVLLGQIVVVPSFEVDFFRHHENVSFLCFQTDLGSNHQ